MATNLTVADVSARISAIEANTDDVAARAAAEALAPQVRAQLTSDTAAWDKARGDFDARHFGYSRYWGSSRRELARDVTPLEQTVQAEQTALARLAAVVSTRTQRLEQGKLDAIAKRYSDVPWQFSLSATEVATFVGGGFNVDAVRADHATFHESMSSDPACILAIAKQQRPSYDFAVALASFNETRRTSARQNGAALFAATRALGGDDALPIYNALNHHRLRTQADVLIAAAVATNHGTADEAKAVQEAMAQGPRALHGLDGGAVGAAAIRAGVGPASAIALFETLHTTLRSEDAAITTYATLVSGKPVDEVLAVRDAFLKDRRTKGHGGYIATLLAASWALDAAGKRDDIVALSGYVQLLREIDDDNVIIT